MSGRAEPAGRETVGGGRLAGALVAVALLASVVGSVGAPLITSVATDLDVSLAAAQWTLTVTLLTGAVAGPVLGRLGAGPHRRRTVLVALGLVALGGALTAAPSGFAPLIVGRALQGLGLGVAPLLMSVARDRLTPDRGGRTIASLSVASTVGIGVGYPLVGLLDQVAGLRAAYGLGFALSAVALVVAWRTLPADTPRAQPPVDVPGALLLGAGTLGVLLVVAVPAVRDEPWRGGAVLAGAAGVLAAWVLVELRTDAPLVDLHLLSRPAVLRANAAMLVAGIGMYLLFSLFTRYLQTPAGAGYGFGLPGVLAGAALIPFSVLGFVAGRVVPRFSARFSARWAAWSSARWADRRADRAAFAAATGSVMLAAVLFAAAPGSPAVVLVAMSVLGFGVGGVSAVMPRLVLVGVPRAETASVLAINQLVRSVGFSVGSALAGLVLAAATRGGVLLPSERGYVTGALWALPVLGLSALPVLLTRRPAAR